MKRQLSSDDIAYRNIASNINKETIIKDLVDGDLSKRMSFADLGKEKVRNELFGVNARSILYTPVEVSIPKTIEKIQKMIFHCQKIKVREIVLATGISQNAVPSILHEKLLV